MGIKTKTSFGPKNNANPKGRPKGSITITPATTRKQCQADFTKIVHEKLLGWKEALVNKMFEKACLGEDIQSLTYLWNMFYNKNSDTLTVNQDIKTAADIDEFQSIILKGMASGDIEPDYGMTLIKASAIKRDSSVVKDLEEKVNVVMEGVEE